MQIVISVLVMLGLITGCKSKTNESTRSGSGSGSDRNTSDGTATTGSNTTSATAAGTGDLKPVSECPPALKGADTGLARVIPANCTTVVEGEYSVDGTLTIEAGATLRFKPDAAMFVGYTAPSKLIVRGTKDKPVTFASAGDQVAGAWRGVHLYAKAARSEITGLVLEYAQIGIDLESPDVVIKDSTFRGTKEMAVRAMDDLTLGGVSGTTFDKPGPLAMSIPPTALVAIGPGNVFSPDSVIQLRGGTAHVSGTWQNPGAPVRVSGEVYIEGKSGKCTIEIAAGTNFLLESGGAMYVGYGGDGELRVAGTTQARVTFRSAGDATPGAWDKGIIVYSHGSLALAYAPVEHGGRENAGAVRVEGGGKLSITASSFKNNVVGVTVDEPSTLLAFDQNELADNKDAALTVFPKHVAALGGASSYTNQRIVIHGGRVEKTATWATQSGAVGVVDGEIYVEGGASLTVPAGAQYSFTEAAAMYVGYGGPGTLIAKGTPQAPITFAGARDDEGSWHGIELSNSAVSNVLENVVLTNAKVGVRVTGAGAAQIDKLTCTKCQEAALQWECGSKVTQTGVKATGGKARATVAPTGC